MSKVLIVAEHDGGKLNPAIAKCVTCARAVPDASVDVAVLAADGAAVAAQAAAIAGVARVLVVNNPANAHALGAVLAPQVAKVLDPEPFALHGIDVRRCRIVGLKSSAHFRAGFEGIARHIVTTDPPGISTSNVAQYPYRRLRRPIYPLDRDATYTPRPPGRPA